MNKLAKLLLGLAVLALAGCTGGGKDTPASLNYTDKGPILTDGTPVTGNVTPGPGVPMDRYSMTVTPGTIYTASVSDPLGGTATGYLAFDGTNVPLALVYSNGATAGTVVFKAPQTAILHLWVYGNYSLTLTVGGAKPAGAPSLSAIAFDLTSITNGQPFTGTLTTANATSVPSISSVSDIHRSRALEIGRGTGSTTTFSGETLGDTRIPTTVIRPASVQMAGATQVNYNYDPEVGPNYHLLIRTSINNVYWEETALVPPTLTVNSNAGVSPLACAPTLAATPTFAKDPVNGTGEQNTISLNPSVNVMAAVSTHLKGSMLVGAAGGAVNAGGGTVVLPMTSINITGIKFDEYARVNLSDNAGGFCTGYYLLFDPLPYDTYGNQTLPLVTNYIVEQRDPVNMINYRSTTTIPVAKFSVLSQ
ncbi:MAG: hypothetical protein OEV94_10955 [Deltaproteobacteria bacterium]|nr:hypothetical protein [Deltaproteobacteria bacterium]